MAFLKKEFYCLLLFGLSFFLFSCQGYNSSSADIYKFTSDGTKFGNAKVVLAMRCGNCHQFHTKTEAELVSLGYIVSGDPTGSSLFSHIRGSNVGGVEDMPPTGSISSTEIQTIEDWIDGL